MSQWVQSKYSKDAKKWEVVHIKEAHLPVAWPYWKVRDEDGIFKELLKSEYIECDPPEQWVTCTREMFFGSPGFPCGPRASAPAVLHPPIGYRWVWSEKDHDALMIQWKVS